MQFSTPFRRDIRDHVQAVNLEAWLWVLLLCLLGYAVTVWMIPIRANTVFDRQPDQSNSMAVLLASDTSMEFYSVSQMPNLFLNDGDLYALPEHGTAYEAPGRRDTVFQEFPFERMLFGPAPRNAPDAFHGTTVISSLRDVIVREATGATLLKIDEARRYHITEDPAVQLVSMDANRMKTISTAVRQGRYDVTIRSIACDVTSSMTVGARDASMMPYLEKNDLPVQRQLRVSPLQGRALFIDHAHLRQVVLADLANVTAVTLRFPEFSAAQVHFSPVFLDEDTIAFSVLDGDRAATVQFDIVRNAYALLSTEFSDAIYVSASGKAVLVQSFLDGMGNVPFGSLAIGMRRLKFDAKVIENEDPSLMRFFQTKKDDTLDFGFWASHSRLQYVRDRDDREFLESLWRWKNDRTIDRTGSAVLLRQEGDAFVTQHVEHFSVNKSRPFFRYDRNVSNLLQALEVPETILSAYETRAAELSGADRPYVLLDVYW